MNGILASHLEGVRVLCTRPLIGQLGDRGLDIKFRSTTVVIGMMLFINMLKSKYVPGSFRSN